MTKLNTHTYSTHTNNNSKLLGEKWKQKLYLLEQSSQVDIDTREHLEKLMHFQGYCHKWQNTISKYRKNKIKIKEFL